MSAAVDQREKMQDIANRMTFLGRCSFYLFVYLNARRTNLDLYSANDLGFIFNYTVTNNECGNNNAISIYLQLARSACRYYIEMWVYALLALKTISSGKAPIFCVHMVPGIHLIGSREEFQFNEL